MNSGCKSAGPGPSPFSFFFFPPTPNPLINDRKPTHCAGWVCAPVRIVSQRGESPRQKEVWPDEAEGNCVAAMRGGEQPKAKDSSVTQVNSIRFVTLASLQSNGEAQMTPTTSKEE